jgi:hypothetical protein
MRKGCNTLTIAPNHNLKLIPSRSVNFQKIKILTYQLFKCFNTSNDIMQRFNVFAHLLDLRLYICNGRIVTSADSWLCDSDSWIKWLCESIRRCNQFLRSRNRREVEAGSWATEAVALVLDFAATRKTIRIWRGLAMKPDEHWTINKAFDTPNAKHNDAA